VPGPPFPPVAVADDALVAVASPPAPAKPSSPGPEKETPAPPPFPPIAAAGFPSLNTDSPSPPFSARQKASEQPAPLAPSVPITVCARTTAGPIVMKASDAAPISDRAKIEREIEFIAAPPVESGPRSGSLETKVTLRFTYEHSKTENSDWGHERVMPDEIQDGVWPRTAVSK
jgi:hypothetical protein